VKGSWRKDKYTCEIVFMDKLLAIVPFEVDDEFEEGENPIYLPNKYHLYMPNTEDKTDGTFEDVMLNLDNMIGLTEIKQKVRDHAKYLTFLKLRRENGFVEEEEVNIHSVFFGNPGTGKTTVASMMGNLYKKMGLLSKGHVHEVDRVDLVGEYIGQTAPKVKEAIDKARGGVLFIDEAYSLARSNDDTKDFGREVIEILVKEMSNGAGDLAVIVAGYPKEMHAFLESNPGLRSRFKYFYEFPDYLPQELIRISDFACEHKQVSLNLEAKSKMNQLITEAYRNRDRTFGNARFVHDLVEQGKINLGLRIMGIESKKFEKEELSEIILSDVEKIKLAKKKILPNIPVDEDLLQQGIAELSALIGMQKVKEQILEMIQLVRFYNESNKNVLNSFYLHTVFLGNPGTGKTTVARILAKIYKALGVLERGQMVETDRQGLVAGYVGQTAIKTTEKIEEAVGGVLFIDEAYALSSYGGAGRGDFGDEAIQTLLKKMEDMRGEFFVFVAGYTDNMETFLKANPGLNSRFDKFLKFEDYNPAEMLLIAHQMLDEQKLTITEDADLHLKNYLEFIYNFRDKYFGNARTVRSIINDIIKKQNLRLAALTPKKRKSINLNEIDLKDLEHLKLDKNDFIFNRRTIGFGK
jgi:SpoVK/Ycf46/Vps4 family AAA+-type ATPase